MNNNKHYQELFNMINRLSYSRDTWDIFCDFMKMAAICISNTVDLKHFDDRETQYLKTIGKYTPEHQKLFPDMFAELILALEYDFKWVISLMFLAICFTDWNCTTNTKGNSLPRNTFVP